VFIIATSNGRRSTNDFLFSSIKTLIVITGPTASGKTALSIEVAKALNTAIISADSRQFYKEMNIGTAKPTKEELIQAEHFFIDSHSIQQELTAAQFAKEASEVIDKLENDVLVVTGGSGMFIDALTIGLDDVPHSDEIRNQLNEELKNNGLNSLVEELQTKDPNYAAICDTQNPARVMRALTVIRLTGKPYSSFLNKKTASKYRVLRFIIDIPRDTLYERINQRVDRMLQEGLLDEVKKLIPLNNKVVLNTVGYKEFLPTLQNEKSLNFAIEQVKMNSRRYAKRQVTWFRRYEDAYWIPFDSIEKMRDQLLVELNKTRLKNWNDS
jgi:tRNA dimethylallyltransferase